MVNFLKEYKLDDQTLRLVTEVKKEVFSVQVKSTVKRVPLRTMLAVLASASLPEPPLDKHLLSPENDSEAKVVESDNHSNTESSPLSDKDF